MSRRTLLRGGIGAGLVAVLSSRWTGIGFDVSAGDELGAPDRHGLRLPAGYAAREIGRSGLPVAGTGLIWPLAPDAGACFANAGGGWSYVCNSEVDGGGGGVVAVHFDAAGSIVGADRLLSGTSRNCGGGATPWGTWLSGEERDGGRMYECDPGRPGSGVARPALGVSWHESAAVDPRNGIVYLSEDRPDGRLYRFVPSRPGDLTAGQLSAASVVDGRVAWVVVASDRPERSASTTAFNGGEGVIVDGSALLLTTKGDDRIWQFDLRTDVVSVFYDGRLPDGSASGVLSGVDQIIMHPLTRDLYVAEDGGDLQLVRVDVGAGAGTGALVPFLQFVGHDQSEVTGPAFSPDGSRLYVSSQRGTDGRTGVTLEISGRFPTLRGVASVSGRDPAVRVDPPGN